MMNPMRWKPLVLAAFAIASTAFVLTLPPHPQAADYHAFADQRRLLGVPHLLNVLSNLPFLLVGALGLLALFGKNRPAFEEPWERRPYVVLMGSIFLTGLGSSYYHLQPTDATLFWDRLPLTLTFSSLLGIVILERVDSKWGARLFGPLLAAGAASLLYGDRWNDLRFYGLLQGWAMAGVPLILVLYRSRYTGTAELAAALALYGVAKAFEVTDLEVFRGTGFVSGHTLKHLFAGGAAYRLYLLLRRRRLACPAIAGAAENPYT